MIERDFEIPFVAGMALREKQIQQNYRPVVAVHKWFARRPGTLFRALLLAEFGNEPVSKRFFHNNAFSEVSVLDPFMGGGTTMLEANRLGCSITGADINPMAWWIVKQELQTLDLAAYRDAAKRLRADLMSALGQYYVTKCLCCGHPASVKYFLWVKTIACSTCEEQVDLFPNYLLSEDVRHPANVFVCGHCGKLYDTPERKSPGPCPNCGRAHTKDFVAHHNTVRCRTCGATNRYPRPESGPPQHRMFAIEYFCDRCSPAHKGRFFKAPDEEDHGRYQETHVRLKAGRPRFIPDAEIPHGDETARLHRWGYRRYRDMFNSRQLLGLETSCRRISKEQDLHSIDALATNLSDLLRYQNMLCRYDTMALKSLDIFSVHGFPVGLIQCESNLLGVSSSSKSGPIGSGGWLNIVEKFAKAKEYCEHPFEIRQTGRSKQVVPILKESIGDSATCDGRSVVRDVTLLCADAASMDFGERRFDAVFTDPPYFRNVQYAELMDFCYVWLKRLVGDRHPEFREASTRHPNELTGNESMGRDLAHFTEGLSAVFRKMAAALKPGSPLAFTYHHNELEAYLPVAVAILDAGLVCSGSIPCPAEMGASIHINGTGSSIIDTVFVCRSTGLYPRRWRASNPRELAAVIQTDIDLLAEGRVEATDGDIRCIAGGHLVRLATRDLRKQWDRLAPTEVRLRCVKDWLTDFGGIDAVLDGLSSLSGRPSRRREEPVVGDARRGLHAEHL
jgi:adenine-specific DNA methylase